MTDETLVHRQIHPSFVQAGFPTSQAFRPTPKDESKLSVYDGDMITAVKGCSTRLALSGRLEWLRDRFLIEMQRE